MKTIAKMSIAVFAVLLMHSALHHRYYQQNAEKRIGSVLQ